jgi:hypothetical protein
VAVNRTIYVKDEDAPLWEEAKEVIGESLSSFLTSQLRQAVAAKRAEAQGLERIVLSFQDTGRKPRRVAFYGRWIISPEDPWKKKTYGVSNDQYAVALSGRGNFVVFNFDDGKKDAAGFYKWGELLHFKSFDDALVALSNREPEDAESDPPDGLITIAMHKAGVVIEELDI